MPELTRLLVAVTLFTAPVLGAPAARAADVDDAEAAGQRASKPVRTVVRAPDGLDLVCESRGAGDTALVFLHGWCGDRHWWKHQADVFAEDYRVVTLDQSGHGESGKGRKEWTIDAFAADVEAVVKHLGLKRVIVVGHSMGGPVALAAAKRMPGTVVAVVGVDTLHNADFRLPEEEVKMRLEAFETDFQGSMRFALGGMLPANVDPELMEWLAGRAEKQDPKIAIAIVHHLARLDLRPLLKDAGVPVRCINAAPKAAQFAAPTNVEANRKYADFRVVIMEKVGHFPMLERPEEFNGKLRDVLKEFAPRQRQ